MNTDPLSLLSELRSAASDYTADLQQVVASVESQIVKTRVSNQDVLPLHPFSHIAKTNCAEGFWQVSKQQWMNDAGAAMFPSSVGFDGQQRPVISGSPGGTAQSVVVWNAAFVDVFEVRMSDNGDWAPARGRALQVRRTYLDSTGRIIGSAIIQDPHLCIEMFHWSADRIHNSVESTYEENEKGKLNPEPLFSSERSYFYDRSGQLLQVIQNDHAIFHNGHGDTLESVTAESVAELSAAIVARILSHSTELPDPSNRLARLVLVYSAEHAHCGLPSDVRFALEADDHLDLFYIEELPAVPNWIPQDKVHAFESLLIRLYQLVDSPEVFLEGDAVLPFRQMLRRLARQIREELSRYPDVVADHFVVYPVDDHGDIDAEDDFRKSVPEELAEIWLAETDEEGSG